MVATQLGHHGRMSFRNFSPPFFSQGVPSSLMLSPNYVCLFFPKAHFSFVCIFDLLLDYLAMHRFD